MAPTTGKAEYVIEDVARCGIFQAILSLLVPTFIKSTAAMSMMFMSFGNYNPGWRCMDNTTGLIPTNHTGVNTTTTTMTDHESEKYVIGSCKDYKRCDDVEFNPESSTIVTDWGLVCDRSWIVSLIISIQMVGMLVGSLLSGQLADFIGRKITLYLGVAVLGVSELISSFSTSWQMFLVLRFFIGIFAIHNTLLVLIYISEFLTRKWRAVVLCFPFWYLGSALLAIAASVVKDWRQIELFGFALSVICFIPIFWVPESLRWLEVKQKTIEFIKVSTKITKLNKKALPSFEEIDITKNCTEKAESKLYTFRDLFRKGYILITISLNVLFFSFSLLYYALSFGAKSLHGDFYFNLVVSSLIPFPFGFGSMLAIRYLSRRVHTIIFLFITILCSIVSIGILLSNNESAKAFGSTVLISISKGTLDVGWFSVYVRLAEIYPTVVRGTGVGVASFSARIGAILSPFLIPDDKSVLYIFMIIMAAVTIICTLISLKLPETKGKQLKQTFEDREPIAIEMNSSLKA